MLKEECLCPLGKERVDDMQFLTHFDTISRRLDEVVEFLQILRVEDGFPSDFYFDVREPLQRIRIEGMYMSADELFALRRSLDTIGRILSLLRKQSGNAADGDDSPLYPSLRALAGTWRLFLE
jgi:DNA mismatch repair protein MutS2